MTSRSPRSRRSVLAAAVVPAAVLSVLGLGACGQGGGDVSASGSPAAPPSGSSTGAAKAAAALGSAGLRLPAGATGVGWAATSVPSMTDTSLVTFTAPAAAVEQMCAAGGLGASLPAAALGPMAQQALQIATPPTGSRICQGSLPADARWNRVVLFGPGDPAQVRVGIFRMPSR